MASVSDSRIVNRNGKRRQWVERLRSEKLTLFSTISSVLGKWGRGLDKEKGQRSQPWIIRVRFEGAKVVRFCCYFWRRGEAE